MAQESKMVDNEVEFVLLLLLTHRNQRRLLAIMYAKTNTKKTEKGPLDKRHFYYVHQLPFCNPTSFATSLQANLFFLVFVFKVC